MDKVKYGPYFQNLKFLLFKRQATGEFTLSGKKASKISVRKNFSYYINIEGGDELNYMYFDLDTPVKIINSHVFNFNNYPDIFYLKSTTENTVEFIFTKKD